MDQLHLEPGWAILYADLRDPFSVSSFLDGLVATVVGHRN